MLKVAAFTGGQNVPSARFRVRQYIGRLAEAGIRMTELPGAFGTYPPKTKAVRPLWAAANLGSRLPSIAKSYYCDVTLLQREMLSTYLTLERFTKRPRVLDVDDAIWLHSRGAFASRLARECDAVICGSSYVADQFQEWNSNVVKIPTGVDTDRYVQGRPVEEPIIGWSGTSGSFKYLYEIELALAAVLERFPSAVLRIVSDSPPKFCRIPETRIEFIRWSPSNEVSAVQGMAVGIMPLDDSLWARGKCSFKMLTYLACGIPVVVSPVGMNAEVLAHGRTGLGAKTLDEWTDALSLLLVNGGQRIEMGKAGRQIVIDNYSFEVVVPKLARTLCQFAVPPNRRPGD